MTTRLLRQIDPAREQAAFALPAAYHTYRIEEVQLLREPRWWYRPSCQHQLDLSFWRDATSLEGPTEPCYLVALREGIAKHSCDRTELERVLAEHVGTTFLPPGLEPPTFARSYYVSRFFLPVDAVRPEPFSRLIESLVRHCAADFAVPEIRVHYRRG